MSWYRHNGLCGHRITEPQKFFPRREPKGAPAIYSALKQKDCRVLGVHRERLEMPAWDEMLVFVKGRNSPYHKSGCLESCKLAWGRDLKP